LGGHLNWLKFWRCDWLWLVGVVAVGQRGHKRLNKNRALRFAYLHESSLSRTYDSLGH
jgi:hypothetical protein